MYLRHTTLRKDGKVHRYWRLVRSVRVGRKVIQQTVAHLGELDPEGRARAKALARAITGDRVQSDLFEPEEPDAAIPVRLKRIRLERGRIFGDVWLGWTLWRALRLDELLDRLLPEGREAVPWSTMAAVLVLARLCEPSSELHIAEDWYRRTALEDLLALPAPLVNDDRLYRALDRVLPHKRAVEQHLVARLGELFALDYDLLLYDVTSTYFEGLAAGNPLAQRGYSRDHRPDCKQVCLALGRPFWRTLGNLPSVRKAALREHPVGRSPTRSRNLGACEGLALRPGLGPCQGPCWLTWGGGRQPAHPRATRTAPSARRADPRAPRTDPGPEQRDGGGARAARRRARRTT